MWNFVILFYYSMNSCILVYQSWNSSTSFMMVSSFRYYFILAAASFLWASTTLKDLKYKFILEVYALLCHLPNTPSTQDVQIPSSNKVEDEIIFLLYILKSGFFPSDHQTEQKTRKLKLFT